jgi:signal transduction histidine kinase/ActR/RegA family two-component response regulator
LKLRSHLLILVLGAVLPVLAFSAVMAVMFWRQQRDAFEKRYLERVRAMSIALDRELQAHIRMLQVLSHSAYLGANDLRGFYEQTRRVQADQSDWSTVALMDDRGQQLFNLQRPFGSTLPTSALDPALLARVATTGRPAVSPLVKGAVSGTYITAIIVSVGAGDGAMRLLVVGIEAPTWLRFLSSIPVISGATMTLLDENGIVIARTLYPDRWVGQRVSPVLYAKARETPEAAYRNIGLEGQWFYTAHSRSTVSGWTVATGVPVADVERELRGSTITMTTGAALMALLAVALAIVFGRRIARPVSALAGAAAALERGDQPPPISTTTAIAEVAEVTHAFDDAARRLRAREALLRASEAESARLAAERARLLDNERAAREDAEMANRLKDEFLATLSHELRTPLTAVLGWARMLRLGHADEQSMERGLASIERNAAAQARLVDDLLDVSRIVSGKMRLDVRVVDLPAVVESAVEAVRPAASAKQIRLQTSLDPLAGPVVGDPDRLQQVVWNLVSNSVKFTPRAGEVWVRLTRGDSHVEIAVSDTGQGMAPEVVPHVFERFRQADSSSTRAHGGLGLGLALVKHLVELHGGSVFAQSTGPGQGATFSVRLPIRVDAERLPAADVPRRAGEATAPNVSANGSLERVRLLCVDDEVDTLELFTQILADTGAEIVTATSVAEAMAQFAQRRPDVLVCDIEMPGEDGYSLVRRVRGLAAEDGGGVPAVAVTAYGRAEDRARLLAAGYDGYIAKPVEPGELVAVVVALAQRSRRDGGHP